jgi:hypothetical protein
VAPLDIVGNDAIVETVLSYKATLFTNGDADVSCYVSLGSEETAASSGYYPSTTAGADEAGCGAVLDYPPSDGTAGHWEFSVASGKPLATYEDASTHPLNGKSHRFTANECSFMKLGTNAMWSAVQFDL